MKKFIFISFFILFLLSMVPAALFYLGPGGATKDKNEVAAIKLSAKAGDRFAFIVMGDTHSGISLNDAYTLKVIRNINREDMYKGKVDIDAVFIVGDETFRGKPSHYNTYVKLISLLKFPVISLVGNHDYDSNKGLFKEFFGADEFAFSSRDSYFIILNNEVGELSDRQLKWFEGELQKGANYEHRFVFLHKPPFNPYQLSWYRMEASAWTRPFMKLCEDYKVDIVFSGHEHMFKEVEFNGVRYIVTGGGGQLPHIPAADGGYIHYVRVNVNGPYVSWEVHKVTPPFWLWITYYLWRDLYYTIKGFII